MSLPKIMTCVAIPELLIVRCCPACKLHRNACASVPRVFQMLFPHALNLIQDASYFQSYVLQFVVSSVAKWSLNQEEEELQLIRQDQGMQRGGVLR